MDDIKDRFIFQKRQRNYDLSSRSDKTQKFNHILNNGQYVISLKLKSEKSKIILKCSALEIQKEYFITFTLENLKEKYNIFNVCKNLDDAYKIFVNIFNNNKAKISAAENSDFIYLNLAVPNIIENFDENIIIKIYKKLKPGETRDGQFLNKILRDNPDLNFNYDLIKTIDNLNKKDLAKDKEIQKLNVLLNDSMRDISVMKKDIEIMKQKLRINGLTNSSNINAPENGYYNIINSTKILKSQNEDKQKIQEDEDNDDEDDDDEEEDEKEYEKEEDTEKVKEKLKQNLMTNKEDLEKDKDSESKIIINSSTNSNNSNAIPIKTEDNTFNKRINNDKNPPPRFVFVKTLIKKTAVKYLGDNNFAVFESLNGEILLVYGIMYYTIHIYDIEKDCIVKIIKDAHKAQITNFRHIRDNIFKKDLLLTVADSIKNIKVWSIQTGTCILNIEKVYNDGFIFSACFLLDEINKMNYVISINYDFEPLKIYDFEGNMIRNINNYDDKSYIVDSYFHPNLKKYFIIVGNEHYIKSYNFHDSTLFKKYYDNSIILHMYFTFLYKDQKLFLIEADMEGFVRIWNFDNALLIKKILVREKLKLRGICLWNENYLIVGASDKYIKIIDLINNRIENLKCTELLCTIKKISSKNLGECLLAQGRSNSGVIKLYKKI